MIPVFYNERQIAEAGNRTSPSIEKPKYVVARWVADHGSKIQIIDPLSREGFASASKWAEDVDIAVLLGLVHNPKYVKRVLSCKEANGFGDFDPNVAKALPEIVRSFISAAYVASEMRGVAVSPTSGFHHAGWNRGGGFCTFNGLALAAVLLARGGQRVLILDIDDHYGNGTEDILFRVEPTLRKDYGIRRIHHQTYGAVAHTKAEALRFIDRIPEMIEEWEPDVVLYQAGADPHENDPIGSRHLSSADMRNRDALVFETCKKLNIGCAWNLAGGYQRDPRLGESLREQIKPVLDLHATTMDECIRVYGGV